MNKKIILLLLSVLVVSFFSSYAMTGDKAAPKWPAEVNEMVAEAKHYIQLINIEDFKAVLDSKNYDLILDVREPNEYEQGHVPGAINMPRGVAEFKIWSEVGFPDKTDMNKRIYIYCMDCGRAPLTTKSLQSLGFTNIYAVDMKIAEWTDAGYPMKKL